MSVEPTSAGADPPAETHYVWVIHGTFNSPEPGTVKWFESGRDGVATFCDALSERLRGTPLEGSVWRLPHGPRLFSWSGQNDHADRVVAGLKLASEMIGVANRDPTARIHLVAHSHGGNVVLKAIEHYHQAIRTAPRLSLLPLPGMPPPEEPGPPDDRLGRVVFLGTPFLRKQWVAPYSFLGDSSNRSVRVLLVLPGVLFRAYLVGLIAMGVFVALSAWLPGSWAFEVVRWVDESLLNFKGVPGQFTFNPIGWPPPVSLVASLFVAWLVIAVFAIDPLYWNTNLYYLKRPGIPTNPSGARIRALVVTARYLDEALIGLSSEPFVYANLATRIHELLRLPVERTGRREHRLIGFDNGLTEGYVNPVFWLFRRFADVGSRIFLIVWKPLRTIFIGPRLTRAVLDILNSAAVGIPADELRGARLAVLPRLDLPDVFEEEYQDVTDLFLREAGQSRRTDAEPAIEQARAERYAFLQSDDALAERMRAETERGSGPWVALVASFNELYKRYQASFELEAGANKVVAMMSRPEFEAETARAWFTTLERLKEASGAIDLNHCLYQSNGEVIDMVARFLITGNALADRAAQAPVRTEMPSSITQWPAGP